MWCNVALSMINNINVIVNLLLIIYKLKLNVSRSKIYFRDWPFVSGYE